MYLLSGTVYFYYSHFPEPGLHVFGDTQFTSLHLSAVVVPSWNPSNLRGPFMNIPISNTTKRKTTSPTIPKSRERAMTILYPETFTSMRCYVFRQEFLPDNPWFLVFLNPLPTLICLAENDRCSGMCRTHPPSIPCGNSPCLMNPFLRQIPSLSE